MQVIRMINGSAVKKRELKDHTISDPLVLQIAANVEARARSV